MSRTITSRDYFQLQEILNKFQLLPNNNIDILLFGDNTGAKLNCLIDLRNKQMRDTGSIRQNYIKDKYKVLVENTIDSQLRCGRAL